MASTMSLTVTPAAFLTTLMRSSDQDWAAHRRAPPIGTLSIVRGARNGRVNCCCTSAARPRAIVDGAYRATDRIVPVSFSHRPDDVGAGVRRRAGNDHGTWIC